MINSHSILNLLKSRESTGIEFLKFIFFGDIAKEWVDSPYPQTIILCMPMCVYVCACMIAMEVREQLKSLFSLPCEGLNSGHLA